MIPSFGEERRNTKSKLFYQLLPGASLTHLIATFIFTFISASNFFSYKVKITTLGTEVK